MAGLSSWKESSLTSSTREKARLELNETEDALQSALSALREAISARESSSYLPCPVEELSDHFLTLFLRARKFDVDRAFTLLTNYCKFRYENPHLFEDVTVESVRRVVERGLPMALKERDSEGRRVLLFRPSLLQPDEMSVDDVHRALLYVLDALIEDAETQVNGFVMVEDWSGMTFYKMRMFDQRSIKRIVDIVQVRFRNFCIFSL